MTDSIPVGIVIFATVLLCIGIYCILTPPSTSELGIVLEHIPTAVPTSSPTCTPTRTMTVTNTPTITKTPTPRFDTWDRAEEYY